MELGNRFEISRHRGRSARERIDQIRKKPVIKQNQYESTLKKLWKTIDSVVKTIEQRPKNNPQIKEEMERILLDLDAGTEFQAISDYMANQMLQRAESLFRWRVYTMMHIATFQTSISEIDIELRSALNPVINTHGYGQRIANLERRLEENADADQEQAQRINNLETRVEENADEIKTVKAEVQAAATANRKTAELLNKLTNIQAHRVVADGNGIQETEE